MAAHLICSPDQPVPNELSPTLLSYSRQVAFGLMYLSFKKYVHRDIAARNILVNDEGICKVHSMMRSINLYYQTLSQQIVLSCTLMHMHTLTVTHSDTNTHTYTHQSQLLSGAYECCVLTFLSPYAWAFNIILYRSLILVYLETCLMKTTMFLMEEKFLSSGQHLKP